MTKTNKPEEYSAKKHGHKINKVTLLLIAGLIGIFLIGIAPMLTKTKSEKKDQTGAEQTLSADEYSQGLENKLKSILEKMDGVGQVEVMVTLKNGYSYHYAITEKVDSDRSEDVKSAEERKTQEKSTTEQNYVLVDGGEGSEPLITALNEPEVKGVVVVCDGGGDSKVVAEVTQAVRVALDISTAKITVSKRSITNS